MFVSQPFVHRIAHDRVGDGWRERLSVLSSLKVVQQYVLISTCQVPTIQES
jgi:hypothetical protein